MIYPLTNPVYLFFGERNTIYQVDSSRKSLSASVKVNTNVPKKSWLPFFFPFLAHSVKSRERKSSGDWCDLLPSLFNGRLSTALCSPVLSYLSIGLFICCFNLLALIVAAGGQEHEDRIFICACARSPTKQTEVIMSPVTYGLCYLFLSMNSYNTRVSSSVYLYSWVLTSNVKKALDECKTSY